MEAQETASSTISTTFEKQPSASPSCATGVVDALLDSLVGVWKLQKSENFDGYLKAQGIGCVARALVAFLDFRISIVRKTNGVKMTIHDYVSEFSVGVWQPLLEHPVTKRKDQWVIVNEESGKLVCRIDGGIGGADNGEVITLEMIDDDEGIKQTLEFTDVVCYRWYIRDPNSSSNNINNGDAEAKWKKFGRREGGGRGGARRSRSQRNQSSSGGEDAKKDEGKENEAKGAEDADAAAPKESGVENQVEGNADNNGADDANDNNNNDGGDNSKANNEPESTQQQGGGGEPRRRGVGDRAKFHCLIS